MQSYQSSSVMMVEAPVIGFCLGFGAIFAAQPAGDAAFYLVVAFEGRGAIAHEHAREVESVDHLFKLVKLCAHVRFFIVTCGFARANIERRGDPTHPR